VLVILEKNSRMNHSLLRWAFVSILLLTASCEPFDKLGPAPYDKPASNTVEQSLSDFISAINTRDSLTFWHLHTWESMTLDQPMRQAQIVWDSTLGSKVSITILDHHEYKHQVHSSEEHAMFSQARLVFRATGSHPVTADTMVAILRADSSLWRIVTISMGPNKPYEGMPGQF
jgi:hypothetical protein